MNENKWKNVESLEDRRSAYSIVSYCDIKHRNDGSVNYIIIADGCRVENHTSDPLYIKDRQAGIKSVIEYFEQKNENYRIELILVDNDAPLDEECKRVARYIDFLSRIDEVKTVNFIAFSKCGVMALNMIKYLQQ